MTMSPVGSIPKFGAPSASLVKPSPANQRQAQILPQLVQARKQPGADGFTKEGTASLIAASFAGSGATPNKSQSKNNNKSDSSTTPAFGKKPKGNPFAVLLENPFAK